MIASGFAMLDNVSYDKLPANQALLTGALPPLRRGIAREQDTQLADEFARLRRALEPRELDDCRAPARERRAPSPGGVAKLGHDAALALPESLKQADFREPPCAAEVGTGLVGLKTYPAS